MGTKAMKLAVASFAALALAGCGPGFEKTASAPQPEPAPMTLPPETRAEEPGGEIRRLAGRAGRRRNAPHRRHRASSRKRDRGHAGAAQGRDPGDRSHAREGGPGALSAWRLRGSPRPGSLTAKSTDSVAT